MSEPTFAMGQIETNGRQFWDRKTSSYNSYSESLLQKSISELFGPSYV
jgi:hypothetical protein